MHSFFHQKPRAHLLWAFMVYLVIFIVLLPRDMVSHWVGEEDVMTYHFSWEKYKRNSFAGESQPNLHLWENAPEVKLSI